MIAGGKLSNSSCSKTQNLICQTTGDLAGLCSCPTYYFYDTNTSSCINQYTEGRYCRNTTYCRSDLGLSCTSDTCQCSTGYYWSSESSTCGIFYFILSFNFNYLQ